MYRDRFPSTLKDASSMNRSAFANQTLLIKPKARYSMSEQPLFTE